MVTPPVRILAVHDAGLVRMKLQTETRQPLANGLQYMPCSGLALAVDLRESTLTRAQELDGASSGAGAAAENA